MKKILLILMVAATVCTQFSCKKGGIEVVSQDTSYQLDPNYIFVDIPKKFNFDTSNIIYLSGQTNITINLLNKGDQSTIDGENPIPLTVKLKSALAEDVAVKLVQDESLMVDYTGNKVGFKPFTAAAFEIPQAVVKKGETSTATKVTLKNLNLFEAEPGYILPLRLELVNPVSGIKISEVFYRIYIKISVKITLDNIDSSNQPIDGTLFNNTITFESNKTNGLSYLKDGNIAGNTWYPANTATYLAMNLPVPETIKGIRINTVSSSYQLGSAQVKVMGENGAYALHGEFKALQAGTVRYIKFKTPVTTKSIRLETLLAMSGNSQPDLTEINFIK